MCHIILENYTCLIVFYYEILKVIEVSYASLRAVLSSVGNDICSTPNPYPSPICPVGVSIIIVKISTLPTLYYPTTHPISIYAEKIQLPSPHWKYQSKMFWVMAI